MLAGSLPPGAPVGWYAELVEALADAGAAVAVDTSDDALLALVDRLATTAPGLLKPNGEELACSPGTTRRPSRRTRRGGRGRRSHAGGRGASARSSPRSAAAGAVLVTADGAWHATPPPTKVVSTVGAGDSSLFGYLLGDLGGLPPAERLRFAVAYGSAAAALPGTTFPPRTRSTPSRSPSTVQRPVPEPPASPHRNRGHS